MIRGLFRYVVQTLALAAVYAGVARLGLMLGAVSGYATLVWPPTGISLATLLLGGYRYWPGIALGAFAVNTWIGAPIPVALGISIGNTLEAVGGAYLVRRLGGFRGSLHNLRHVLGLVALGALASTTISATVGVSSLLWAGIVSLGEMVETWRAWWLGDALGDLVVASLLLAWRGARRFRIEPRRLAEAAALSASVMGASLLIFARSPTSVATGFAQAFMLIPLLTWAAVRFGMRGATATVLLVSIIAIWGTTLGRGPFVQESLSRSLLFLQAFMGVAAVTVLVMGAVIAERTEAIQRREELVAIVSHDLKNPLNVVQMAAQSLQKQLPPGQAGDRARAQVAIVERSIDRMSSLIRDLLDLSALDAGRLELRRQEHDAGSLVAEAVEMMRPLAENKSQELRQAVPREPIRVLCDRERVLQVFSNLVGNALKFTPAGGSVTVSVGPFDDEVLFSVADTGPRIPQDQLPHVFERFWKAPQASEEGAPGAGLGLSIAKAIVEAHGGTIWADSQEGAGSTFHLTLSAAKALSNRAATWSAEARLATGTRA